MNTNTKTKSHRRAEHNATHSFCLFFWLIYYLCVYTTCLLSHQGPLRNAISSNVICYTYCRTGNETTLTLTLTLTTLCNIITCKGAFWKWNINTQVSRRWISTEAVWKALEAIMLLRSWAAVSHSARYPGLLTDCCSATFIPQTDVHFGLEFLLQQQQQQQVQQNNNNDASGQLCHDVMTILPLLMCMWPSYSQNKGFILLYIVCLQPARRQENTLKYKFLFCKWENRRVQHWQHLTNSSIYTPIYARVCVCYRTFLQVRHL